MKKKVNIKPNKKEFTSYPTPVMFMGFDMKLVDGHTDVYEYTDAEMANTYMHERGIACACAIKLQFDNAVVCNTVLHDSGYEKLPKYVQEFLMQHEIGHIKNGDLESLSDKEAQTLILKRALGILPSMEVKADAYAASIVGKKTACKALAFLAKFTDLPFSSKFELCRRYKKILKG